MKMYKVINVFGTIEEVDIVRATSSTVFFIKNGKELREKRYTNFCSYHDTNNDAVNYLIQKAEERQDALSKALVAIQLRIEALQKKLN